MIFGVVNYLTYLRNAVPDRSLLGRVLHSLHNLIQVNFLDQKWSR